jgi:hypothetical protein
MAQAVCAFRESFLENPDVTASGFLLFWVPTLLTFNQPIKVSLTFVLLEAPQHLPPR